MNTADWKSNVNTHNEQYRGGKKTSRIQKRKQRKLAPRFQVRLQLRHNKIRKRQTTNTNYLRKNY